MSRGTSLPSRVSCPSIPFAIQLSDAPSSSDSARAWDRPGRLRRISISRERERWRRRVGTAGFFEQQCGTHGVLVTDRQRQFLMAPYCSARARSVFEYFEAAGPLVRLVDVASRRPASPAGLLCSRPLKGLATARSASNRAPTDLAFDDVAILKPAYQHLR
jgi:hypothetical protein